jgi:hypothetical protein
MLHLILVLASPVAAQCAAMEAMVMPAFDPNAPVSVDVLDGPAPTNLVVLRMQDGAPAFAQLTHDDTTVDLEQSVTGGFLPRFDAAPLVADGAYTLTLSDSFTEEGDPGAQSRTVTFTSSSLTDVEPPRIKGEPTFHVEHFRGGPSVECGPQWVPDHHAYTVELPKAEDDVGVAAFELRATQDGIESAIAGTVAVKGAVIEAIVWGDEPDRLRVVAIDHAGNESKPEEASDEAGGCAQSKAASPLAALALLLALVRRRR